MALQQSLGFCKDDVAKCRKDRSLHIIKLGYRIGMVGMSCSLSGLQHRGERLRDQEVASPW